MNAIGVQTCEVCEKVPSGKQRRFCSQTCAGRAVGKTNKGRTGEANPRWGGGPLLVVCEECGASFTVQRSQAERGRGRFCSKACMGKWRRREVHGEAHPRYGRIEVICLTCEKQFTVNAHRYQKRPEGPWFCGTECQRAWQKTRSGPGIGRWKGGKIAVKCAQCSEEKWVYPCNDDGKLHFCEMKCYAEWQSANRRGAAAFTWKGGASDERGLWWQNGGQEWTKEVKQRAAYRCELCGMEHSRYSTRVHVHHRLSFAEYPDLRSLPENGAMLCDGCHYFVHSNVGAEVRKELAEEVLL